VIKEGKCSSTNPKMTTDGTITVLDTLIEFLTKAADYNPNDQSAPSVILWTDKEHQWEPLIPVLRERLPFLLTSGSYDTITKTGPAIWIKCMIARTLPEADWSQETVPILYLPGVSRQELRAVKECPKDLQPLAELQYRGVYWTQINSRDWTLLAFLQSKDGGLGLDVARDSETLEAMKRALLKLAETSVEEIQGKRLEAVDFDALVVDDPARDLLMWLNDPASTRERWDADKWDTFRNLCKTQFNFDPQTDGELTGAELLGQRHGNWQKVWARFAEIPKRYTHLPELLRRARPAKSDGLFFKKDSWPQDNETMEAELRSVLTALKDCSHLEAITRIKELEKIHAERRGWVWTELGQAPLACSLKYLTILSESVQNRLIGASLEEIAQKYINEGWRADAAALDALTALQDNNDVEAVIRAIRIIYQPWIQEGAEKFQALIKDQFPDAFKYHDKNGTDEEGTVRLFVDGMRFDIGQKVKDLLLEEGFHVEETWHWVALPSVTPTSKPAVSPVVDLLTAESIPEEFRPAILSTGKTLTPDRFKGLLVEKGYQFLSGGETGDPSGKAWSEYGDLDRYGHLEGWKLSKRIGELVLGLVSRIEKLLEAGWKKVRIVTDHGWLLLPGGLPKTEMPGFLVETRWGRCALLKTTSVMDILMIPWFWNREVYIAIAPGISAFRGGLEYDHGGLTFQECVVPEFYVAKTAPGIREVNIVSVEWRGLVCRIRVKGAESGMKADLRTKAADGKTSITKAKVIGEDGQVALYVEDDRLEGTATLVVILGKGGNAIAKQPTTVGG